MLVIPKHEESYIFNLDDEEYAAFTLFAKRVAAALEKAMPIPQSLRRPAQV